MPGKLNRREILSWLRETDEKRLGELWRLADETRRQCVGDAVHLRGLVEFSNHCSRQCWYCGIRAGNGRIGRYRMTAEEIIACAHRAVYLGYGTVVLQSGEDAKMGAEWMAGIVRRIKKETRLAVTLSLGERSAEELAFWKDVGADRYLLRFETSGLALFDKIHPPRGEFPSDRISLLRTIKSLGYETGSGVMIGIPGQTYESLADDIILFGELDLDMIGVGPYIAHPDTPLSKAASKMQTELSWQVPADELMTYKTVALARLVRPTANIPSTTALATLNRRNGRELGLSRGANVVMPNITPVEYRKKYEIYPAKACLYEREQECQSCLGMRIRALGRTIGTGRGDATGHRAQEQTLSY